MISFAPGPVAVPDLRVRIGFEALADKIRTSSARPGLIDAARAVFETHRDTWEPAMTYQWLGFTPGSTGESGIIAPMASPEAGTGEVELRLGHSGRFLSNARYVLAAVYTAGPRLDAAAAEAGKNNDFLDAHFLDLLGLIVLEQAEQAVKDLASEKAADAGWGVSPFLSPGSVHGWELSEQKKLAGLLPISDIRVSISDAAVFSPFKTISCIIGIGPAYEDTRVGSTCQVCAKRDHCQMKTSLKHE